MYECVRYLYVLVFKWNRNRWIFDFLRVFSSERETDSNKYNGKPHYYETCTIYSLKYNKIQSCHSNAFTACCGIPFSKIALSISTYISGTLCKHLTTNIPLFFSASFPYWIPGKYHPKISAFVLETSTSKWKSVIASICQRIKAFRMQLGIKTACVEFLNDDKLYCQIDQNRISVN